jgi:aminoglycoside phosphotransferase (APT) family kinase protein
MPIAGRYQPGAVRTPFVDREDALKIFDREVGRLGQIPRLLEVHGVGGIGKSRLLHELRSRVPSHVPTAAVNLQEPEQRSALLALAALRSQFGAAGVPFNRFDIAYAVWWQRLNPLVALTEARIPWLAQSEVLGSVVGEAMTGVPLFGNAVALLEQVSKRFRRWDTIRHDPTLGELADMSAELLGDAVVYLFAQDLEAHGPHVLFIDAYEALVGGVARGGTVARADHWLRDLLGQLDHLTVLASREPVDWALRQPEWAERIRSVEITPLPYAARIDLLDALGVDDPTVSRAIAEECQGLPYFLHVARESGGNARAYARIEERFLAHVTPDIIRTLELLSVARIFDHKIFLEVARYYDLRADMAVWETLTSYSFVAPAGVTTLQMHQLMAKAVRARLSEDVVGEMHELLREVWTARAVQMNSLQAWREAAFHAASAAGCSEAGLLQYLDAVAGHGKTGLDEMLADRRELGMGDDDLSRLLEVEAHLVVGDARSALACIDDRIVPANFGPGTSEVGARLALAVANAHRIAGDTMEAVRRYALIWPTYSGLCRLDAGAWLADLTMARGRFAEAVAIAGAVEREAPLERKVLLADLARLRALAHRFAFDPVGARAQLELARQRYTSASHEVGLANVLTNEAEILVLDSPATAIRVARRAVAAQRVLGADHELGKSLTALALGLIATGDTASAGGVLTEACQVLERCGYRSGRARAELAWACLHARVGMREAAVSSARRAVSELESMAVYPALILLAELVVDRIGCPTPEITAAAQRARESIDPLGDMSSLLDVARLFIIELVGDDWDKVKAEAEEADAPLAGYYNRNFRHGPYLVRIPMSDADGMDLRIWHEADVLATIGGTVANVPRLLSLSRSPEYQIHDWVEGRLLDEVAPKGVHLPSRVPTRMAGILGELAKVPIQELPPVPSDWPDDGNSVAFARAILGVTRAVHAKFGEEYGGLWRSLGIPADPFAVLELDALASRPFVLVHSDVHRKNTIIRSDDSLVLLDWELALLGDPVYELAVHIHKMEYLPDEEVEFREAWASIWASGAGAPRQWMEDLDRYLAHERVKSALVDAVRYSKGRDVARASDLARKLERARQIWGDNTAVGVDEIESILANWTV